MVLLDRTPRKDDPWLRFKVWAFTVGGGLALGGIHLGQRWLIWVAIGVLFLGFGARFLPRTKTSEETSEEESAGSGTDHP